ncbi:MAG: hypothetical protein RLO50_05960 [Azospirillaceae bacterium]
MKPEATAGDIPDLSLVVLADRQGTRLHGTITAAMRAIGQARAAGWSVEPLVVRSGDDPVTGRWLAVKLDPAWRVVTAAAEGTGGRMAGVAACRGRLVGFMIGGDLCSANWLSGVLDAAARRTEACVWRPEGVVSFGPDYMGGTGYAFDLQSDSSLDPAAIDRLLARHPYSSQLVASRAVFDAVPFPSADPSRGWNDLDWWWTCNTLAAGFAHRIVPATFHYQRADALGQPLSLPLPPEKRRIGPSPLWRVPLETTPELAPVD